MTEEDRELQRMIDALRMVEWALRAALQAPTFIENEFAKSDAA